MPLDKFDPNVPNNTCSHTGGLKTINIDKTIAFKKALFSRTHKTISLADNDYLTVAFTIPAGVEIHVVSVTLWALGAPHIFEHLPFCSFTPGGTALTPRNHYVNHVTPSSVLTLYTAPTDIVPVPGATMDFYFGGGTGIAHVSSSAIFSPDGEYIFTAGSHISRIQNLSGAATPAQMQLTWYELNE